MKRIVVLVSGKQGSGKDTLVDSLTEVWGAHAYFNTLKFAKTIYEMHDECRRILRSKGVVIKPEKEGELLQYLGTDWGRRHYGQNVWVNCFKADCLHIFGHYKRKQVKDPVVIMCSDLRFRNEFDAFKDTSDIKVFRVRLRCDRETRMKRATSWRDNENHVSETDLDAYDIENKFDLYINTGRLTKKQALQKLQSFLAPEILPIQKGIQL